MRRVIYSLLLCLLVMTTAAGQWTQAAFPGNSLYALLVDDEYMLASLRFNLARSGDGGMTWDTLASPSMMDIYNFKQSAGFVFGNTFWAIVCEDSLPRPQPCIFRSADSGTSWDTLYQSVGGAPLLSSIDEHLFAQISDSHLTIFHSPDTGHTWLPIETAAMSFNELQDMDSDAELLYVILDKGQLFRSDDYGATWSQIAVPSEEFTSLAVRDSLLVLYGYSDSLWISEDAGSSWSLVDSELPVNGWISAMTIIGQDLISLVISNFKPVICQFNLIKRSWRYFHDGLELPRYGWIYDIGYDNDFIYVTTDNGLWKRSLQDLTAIEKGRESLPDRVFLSQNYPNPFNPVTTIRYALTVTSNVELSIFNLLGQKVATLVSAKQPAGSYSMQWNASGMPSGVYLYRMQTDDGFSQTQKLVLIR